MFVYGELGSPLFPGFPGNLITLASVSGRPLVRCGIELIMLSQQQYQVWFGLSVVGAQAEPLMKPIVLFRFGRTKYWSLPQTSEYYEFPIRQRLILENI